MGQKLFNMQTGEWEDAPGAPAGIAGPGYDPSAPNGVNFASLLGQAGIAAGGVANSMAGNRQVQTAQGQTGTSADTAGLRNFLHANYIASGGAKPTTSILPNMIGGPSASTPEAQAFATNLRSELQKRLKEGKPLSVSGGQGAGWGEKLAGILALAGAGTATALTGGAAAPLLGPAAGYAMSKF
jgi:hypothetical protein